MSRCGGRGSKGPYILVHQPDFLTDEEFSKQLQMVVPALRGYARKLTRSGDQADDLCQDAAQKAWAARHRFRRGTSFQAWIFRIARNRFLSGIRLGRWWGPMPAAEPTCGPSQIDSLILKDIERKIATLPASQRQAVLLAAAGASYDEAAAAMHCEVGTVKSRLSRAQRALGEAA